MFYISVKGLLFVNSMYGTTKLPVVDIKQLETVYGIGFAFVNVFLGKSMKI